jgi:mono/diheme cytochrome c family protein
LTQINEKPPSRGLLNRLEGVAMTAIGHLARSICVLASVLAAGEAAAQQASQSAGLALARRLCSECHAVEAMVPSPNLDAPSFSKLANTRGMTARYLWVEFRRAHQTMPDFDLERGELRDIIAHIMSLRSRAR